jgi:PAS domain S-box-containing protein
LSTLIKNDGTIIETEVNANYINFNGIELNCAFVRDITERKRTEDEKEKPHLNSEAIINSTTNLMWSVDQRFNLIEGNKAFIEKMMANTGVQLKPGESVFIKDNFADKDIQHWKEMYNTVLTGKAIHTQINLTYPDNNGLGWIEFYLNPIYNGGAITGVACYGEDITKRKQQEATVIELNKQIKLRANELTASNKELEEFAYVASHDLQEPLRMVSSFLQLLEKKYNNQLDEKGKQYIHFAVDGAARMRQIILDLLEYSRVGKGKQLPEPINLHKLLEDVVLLNTVAIKECNGIVEWKQLPDIYGIKLSIQQVFQNLISNSLKYQQPGNNAVIKISAIETELHWQFEVADNGIGIEPSFHDKIFVVFQRLHGKGKYEGNGIGLSICKKIIEKEGGKIWVESEKDKGCSFFFTIKK